MTIKIEIPADYPLLINAVGKALASYKGESPFGALGAGPAKASQDVSHEEKSVLPEEVVDRASDGSNTTFDSPENVASAAATIEQITQAEVNAGNLPAMSAGHPQQDAEGKYLTDYNGVMHIPAVCGVAEKPFYASGTNKGQWKRKGGVTEDEYNRVYADALSQVAGTNTGSTSPDTAAGQDQNQASDPSAEQAFGGQGQGQLTSVTPNDVFTAFTSVCQAGDVASTELATKCFTDAGLANPSLIFSRPDLAAQIFATLSPIHLGGG